MFDFGGGTAANLILNGSINTGKFLHAYLFCGEEFVGKRTIAKKFAMSICCAKQEQEKRPCFECISCKKILNGNYADYIELGSANFFDKCGLSVDEARSLINQAFVKPIEGKYKVFVICGVESLLASAANVLLKLLEEPPKNVIFILTARNKYDVLPTIVSRCALVNISGIGKQRCFEILKEDCFDYNKDILKKAVELGEGSLKKTQCLLQNLDWKDALEIAEGLFAAYMKKNELRFLQYIAKIKNDLNLVCLIFHLFCVNICYLIKRHTDSGGKISLNFYKEILRAFSCFERAKFLILRNCNLKLVLTNLCSSLFWNI